MASSPPSFVTSITHLKEVSLNINNAKMQDLVTTRSLYVALSKVLEAAKHAPQAELVANNNLNALEDIFSGKYIVLSKGMQTLLISIYGIVLATTPGYAVRNVVNNLMTICGNKSAISGARECASTIIGEVMLKRPMDCGSMVNDIITCMIKLVKGSDHGVRITSLNCLINLTIGSGTRIADCHGELTKLATKLISDRAADIRHGVCRLITEITKYSSGCTSISIDLLLVPVIKGLEDEVAAIQESSAMAVAIIFNEQIDSYIEEQEQLKIGHARGGASSESENEQSKSRFSRSGSSSLAKLKDMTSVMPKKLIEEYDFKTVIKFLIKQIIKTIGQLRAAYIISLLHLIKIRILSLDKAEFEWLIIAIISILHDPMISAMSYEDIVYFRSRLGFLLRKSITCNLTESSQITFATMLTEFIANSDNIHIHTEHELQLALGELGHIITALGEASVAVLEDVRSCASIQLRNASFGVRAAAAYVLTGISTVIPAVAASYLREALINATTQMKLLTTYDINEPGINEDIPDPSSSSSSSSTTSGKKKSPKETERLQRMFCFHGHTLVISIFLKNERWLPTGLPKSLVLEVFDFGLELLKQDVMSAPPSIRHVICSVIRAGSLIVSSCLNMGYKIARSKISRLLIHCQLLLSATLNPSPPNNSTNELLYELMSVEAALVCISTLLWFCPEALVYADNCLVLIVEGLENAFRAVKTKYQPKFRNHFRFRALHVILLECFAWLPPGSFPNTCQQLFVEALRVFRDSISAGYESTCLYEFIRPEFTILNAAGIQKPIFSPGGDMPQSECSMMLKLEQNATALQKKESEAFLAAFTKDVRWSDFHSPLQTNSWTEPSPPCAHLEARTVDGSIALLAASFGHQTNEYQEKAMQLCSQAVAQFLKSSSALGIFSSEEEKRKKDKKGYIIVKNVISCLSAIVRSFPFHNGMSFDLDLVWVQSVADRMFELLSYQNNDIRSAAANALSIFCAKIHGSSLMENMASKIASTIRAALDKKADVMNECLGYILALACFWEHSKDMPDIQSSISSVIFDCLKKVDCSLSFRAFSIFAMSIMVKNRAVGASMQDVNETIKLVTRVCQVTETHLVCVGNSDTSTSYEYDLLLVCLQRLINNTVPVILDVDPTSSLMVRFVQLWDMIRSCSSNLILERETTEFVVAICLFPPGVTTIDRLTVARSLHHALERKGETSFVSLQVTVEAVRALMLQDAECAFEAGLDIELFKLLDWCIASSTVTCSSAYWGLELRPGVDNALGTARDLQYIIEAVLDSLISIDVKQNPDTRAAHWALLCRAVALGLRIGGEESSVIDTGNNGGEIENALEAFERDNKTTDVVVKNEVKGLSHQMFCTWARDKAVDKAQGIAAARVRLKCVAIRCATTALNGVLSQPLHADLILARKMTQDNLDKLGLTPDSSTLEKIPCYLPLFLHDFVNFACACATYSVEDHRLLSLLAASAEFLECLLVMFWDTIDPDAIIITTDVATSSSSYGNRILQQFISQIVSALRTCLSAEWHPSLLFTVGGLANDLMRGEFLSDKVMVRRVAKLLLPPPSTTTTTTTESETPTTVNVNSLAILSPLVADEVSTISHIVMFTNAARLYLLTSFSGPCRNVKNEIKTAVQSILQDQLSSYMDVWYAMILDAVRVLQGTRQWPKITSNDMPSASNGGLCYGPSVDHTRLLVHLELALPYLVAAISQCTTLTNAQLSAIFSISLIVLEDLRNSTYKLSNSMKSNEQIGLGVDLGPLRSSNGKRTFLDDLVLSAFASICKQNKNFEVIKLSQWMKLVTFLASRLIPNRLYESNRHSNEELCSLCSTYLDVFDPLLEQILNDSNNINITSNSTSTTTSTNDDSNGTSVTDMLEVLRLGIFSIIVPIVDVAFSNEISMQSLVSAVTIRFELISKTIAMMYSKLIQRSMEILSKLSKISQNLISYTSKLISSLIPLLALILPTGQAKIAVIQSLQSCLVEISKKSPSTLCVYFQPSDELIILQLEHLLMWQSILSNDDILNQKNKNAALLLSTGSSTTHDAGPLPSPTQVAVLILSPGTGTNTDFLRALLSTILRTIQSDPLGMGSILACTVVPAILSRITSENISYKNESIELLMIQIIFLLFSITPEIHRETLLAMIVTPLCSFMSLRTIEYPVTQLCGKGITHLARVCPEPFKLQVTSLSDKHRSSLQSVMRSVLEQQSNANVTSGGGSVDSTANVKKIDMSRYRKGQKFRLLQGLNLRVHAQWISSPSP
eukprot:gene1008-1979_t